MFRTSISKLAILFIITIFFASCTIPLKAIRTGPENPATVPKEFDPLSDTLLVIAISQLENTDLIDMKSTIKLEEELQKHYPYPYKMVYPKQLTELTAQNDENTTYRFALVSERRMVKQKGSFQLDFEDGFSYAPGYKATYFDFSFYDRQTRQRFPPSGTSNTVMKLAVQNLTVLVDKARGRKSIERQRVSSVQKRSSTWKNTEFGRN